METTIELERKTVLKTPVCEGRYLTFSLCSEEYGMELIKVREIIRTANINIISESSSCEKMLANIFGTVIPVIDMKLKLGFGGAAYTESTCIIVVEVQNKLIGLVVDAVSEVIDVKNETLEPSLNSKNSSMGDFFLGKVKIHDKFKHLLDIDRVMGMEEIGNLGNFPS